MRNAILVVLATCDSLGKPATETLEELVEPFLEQEETQEREEV